MMTASAGTGPGRLSPGGASSAPTGAPRERRAAFGWFTRHSWLGPVAALAALYVVFAVLRPDTFSTLSTLRTMVRQTTMVGVAALGMTVVIILGGIDLSVGSMVALTTIVIAKLLGAGFSPFFAALGGVAAAAFCGFVNGTLITWLRVTPFIVTLGAMGIIRGAAKGLAREQKVDAPITWLNDLLAELEKGSAWQIFPPGVWVMIVLALAVGFLLRYTRLGRHVFAIGSNEQAARVCGIDIARVKIAVYALAAALAGVAGVMQFSRLTVGDPTVAAGLELDVIAAVVIGGGSMSGGEGSIVGALVGAMLMTEIKTGCTHLGLSIWVQEIITGLIIVAAVALDRLRHRRGRWGG